MHDPRISALLRLKRFEQPPPGYFDELLKEVHRRQRSELLHRPLWKIALERTQVFFSEHSMGSLSYAGAMAAVLVVGVTAIGLITPGKFETGKAGNSLAENGNPPPTPKVAIDHGSNRMIVLGPQGNAMLTSLGAQRADRVESGISAPRYIIDARPASYEPAFSF
ncbi:MAG: hypothetical protein WCF18_11340 [Chthoniobacteraceae bacterium]